MSTDSVGEFIDWVTAYDYRPLHNEDDVETKFVLPFFQRLGYPDTHRHGKYPVPGYQPGRSGRKAEVDHVYFAEGDQQSANTALVIVEAKHPQERILAHAIEQAQFYGERLKPLLLVITNGWHIIVLKRHRYREDERIFDIDIADLKDTTQADAFYALLNFQTVRQLRQRVVDELTHAQFVQLDHVLREYPNIQAILATGDFTPATSRDGRYLTVVNPKAAIEGMLPVGFGTGSCEISFSHVLRRGLTIHLDHNDILGSLMMGLGTPAEWGARRFVQLEEDGSFLVQLGRTTTLLSAEEARDLYACVDVFAGAYRDVFWDAEDVLETWQYPMVLTDRGPGFYLLSVPSLLWKRMRKFADEFEWGNGDTPWHMFEDYIPALRVSHKDQDHVFIYGVTDPPHTFTTLTDHMHLVYVLPDIIMQETADQSSAPWQQSIGIKGLWTAAFTRHWIENEFIPAIRSHVAGRETIGAAEWKTAVIREELKVHKYATIHSLQRPEQLIAYLADIQHWLTSYSVERVPTALLRPTCLALLELARHADPTHINLHYVASKLGGVEGIKQDEYVSFQYGRNPTRIQQVYTDVLRLLQLYVDYIHTEEFVTYRRADRFFRSTITIVEQGRIACSQVTLNQAAEVVNTLWRQSRFELRHVWPIITSP